MPYPVASIQAAVGSRAGRAGEPAVPWYTLGGALGRVAYQPLGAASLAASYVNLINPGTNNAGLGVAPTFDAGSGWTFNGSNQWLTTGVTPAEQGWSYLIRVSDVTENTALFGSYEVGAYASQISIAINGSNAQFRAGGLLSVAVGESAGVWGIAGNKAYKNGTPLAGTIPAASKNYYAILIGSINSASGAADKTACKVQAFYMAEGVLSDAQMAAITARMAALPL